VSYYNAYDVDDLLLNDDEEDDTLRRRTRIYVFVRRLRDDGVDEWDDIDEELWAWV